MALDEIHTTCSRGFLLWDSTEQLRVVKWRRHGAPAVTSQANLGGVEGHPGLLTTSLHGGIKMQSPPSTAKANQACKCAPSAGSCMRPRRKPSFLTAAGRGGWRSFRCDETVATIEPPSIIHDEAKEAFAFLEWLRLWVLLWLILGRSQFRTLLFRIRPRITDNFTFAVLDDANFHIL